MRTLSPLLLLVSLLACKDGDDPSTDSLADDSTTGSDSDADDSAPDDSDADDADGDGYSAAEDCDDNDAAVNPGAAELCDGRDNNCDGAVDEGVQGAWYTDADGDGHGAGDPTLACEAPDGTSSSAGDCDDADPRYYPGAEESDCSDPNDYNCDGSVGYADGDGDGFAACEECDDGAAGTYPGAEEVCDSTDNNCDGAVDEGLTSTFYQDADGDGYGDPDYATVACTQPSGYVPDASDCDDSDSAIHPAASEVCDGADNDCDSLVDDSDPSLDAASAQGWTLDTDGDGYGDDSTAGRSCTVPSGATTTGGDCDDSDASVNPGATELCDGVDNDCDGATDDADSSVDLATAATWYSDSDGDGYGDAGASTAACSQPSGAVADSSDCDDSDSAVNPGASEVCDGADNDCDGTTDDADSSLDSSTTTRWYADTDGDGYGDKNNSVKACDRPSGYRANLRDCDDSDATISPAASEACNFIDDDCDGTVDDGLPDLDASGLEDCKEVAVILSAGFQSRSASYTCDGVSPMTTEFNAIDAALGDMGLGGVRFLEDSSAGFAAADVSIYGAVILHNGGWSDLWRTGSDTSIATLMAAGMPMLVLGDDGIYNASNTATNAGTTTMWDLTRTTAFLNNGSGTRGTTVSVASSGASHPVAVGRYGSVSPFTYLADLDQMTMAGADETVVMESAAGYPVIWAAEDGTTGQRVVVFLPSVYNSHDCPISDTAGLAELEVVFKNSVDWAMGW